MSTTLSRFFSPFLLLSVIVLAATAMATSADEQELQGHPISGAAEEKYNAPAPDGIRPGGTLSDELSSPKIPREISTSKRPVRNYPEQPPMVPHTIRGYQVTKNFNQCLTCHNRSRSVETGAPMVSITHYLDRDSQPLAAVSPRRYFCLQCHVPQHDVAPARGNHFKSIDQVLQESQQATE
jgi:cytochrome c-type protein NapB